MIASAVAEAEAEAVPAAPARSIKTLLVCRGLALARGGRRLLDGLDVELRAGELLAVTGPSGSGKSTLLRVLAGLERAQAGTVVVDGQRRGAIAVAFQDPGLPAAVTGLEAILAGRLHCAPWWRGWLGMPAERSDDARMLAGRLGVAHLLARSLATASGGERQRLAVARALHHGGRVVLLDEPVSQLDPDTATLIMQRLRDAADLGGRAVLVVVHQPGLVEAFADRELRLAGDGTWTLRDLHRRPT